VAAGGAQPASATIITGTGLSYQAGDSFSLTGSATDQIDLFASFSMGGELNLGLDAPGGMGSGSTVEFASFGTGMSSFLELLAPGDTVDGSLTFWNTPSHLVEDDVVNSSWPAGTTGYAGFSFDLSGSTVYGYLRIEFDAGGNDFTVLSWAYEDSGAPIEVLEPTAVALFGLGALGLVLAGRWLRSPERSPRPSG
jgi:hypothetical protein